MPVEFGLDIFGNEPRIVCECCAHRYVSVTMTTSTPHKWTKEEIEQEIIFLSAELVEARWYNRGNLKDRLKHWHKKLEQYNEAESEFNFNPHA